MLFFTFVVRIFCVFSGKKAPHTHTHLHVLSLSRIHDKTNDKMKNDNTRILFASFFRFILQTATAFRIKKKKLENARVRISDEFACIRTRLELMHMQKSVEFLSHFFWCHFLSICSNFLSMNSPYDTHQPQKEIHTEAV